MLVLRSGALGDFLLTLPVLEALRSHLPHEVVSYAGRGEFGKLARRSDLVDEVIDENRPEVVALYSEATDAADGIARGLGRVDLALSFVSSDAVARNLLAAGVREVLSCSARPPAGGAVHAADHLMSTLRGRFDVPARAVPRLYVPEGPRERARGAVAERGMEPGGFIVLHPGSGSSRKNWPAERFAEDYLRMVRAVRFAVRLWFDRSPLALLAGVLSECAGFVGNDSGVTHLAAACGAPTVAVFGPTDPGIWGPRGEHVSVVRDPSGEVGRVGVDRVMEALRAVAGKGRDSPGPERPGSREG